MQNGSLEKTSRLVAIDPSIASSGWAVFCLESKSLLSIGTIRDKHSKQSDEFRLLEIQKEIGLLFECEKFGRGDFIVCEGPAHLVLNPQTALKVERVRGIFETLARAREVEVPGRVNPRTLQCEVIGLQGSQLPRKEVKAIAKRTALQLFGKDLLKVSPLKEPSSHVQDIFDALLIGAFSMSRIDIALKTNSPICLDSFGNKREKGNYSNAWR